MSSFRDTFAPQRPDREVYDYFLEVKRNASTRFGRVMRSAVANTEASEFPMADPTAVRVFSAIEERSIPGNMPGLVRPPLYVPLTGLTGGTAAFVGQSKAIPASKVTLSTQSLKRKKIAGLAVVSNELTQASGNRASHLFESILRRRAALVLDEAFLSDGPATDSTPAGILNGAATIAATSDPQNDLAELIEHFDGDLASSVFISDPLTATRLALSRDTSGGFMFPDLGPRGGSALNVPFLTTRGSPVDTGGGNLVLADASGIAYLSEGGSFQMSNDVLLEQDSTPTGASDTPTAATATFMNAFQEELTAIKVVIYADWVVMREGAVAVITGASY
jgi:HK97 family phage major capsid protein